MNNAALPLADIRVVDLGFGQAAALVAKFLAEAGAIVTRFEPVSSDPFYDIYPAYAAWRAPLARISPFDAAHFAAELEQSDICLLGGEAFEGLMPAIATDDIAIHDRLIVLDIAPTLPNSPITFEETADILIQAQTGIVFETLADKPALMATSFSGYGAAFQSLIAISAALYVREERGYGQKISVGLVEGAITMMAPLWTKAEREPFWFSFKVPRGASPIVLQCADGRYVHIVLGSAGAKYKLYQVLGIDDPAIAPDASGMPDPTEPSERFFGDLPFLTPFVKAWDSGALLAALSAAGVVAGPVLAPGICWDDPQALHNGIIVTDADGHVSVGHPVKWSAPDNEADYSRPKSVEGLPLAGIKVVDFGAYVAGPSASVGLADLGAEVVKVEPITGDPMRGAYSFFTAANRGKMSIAVNLKEPEGLSIAQSIASRADIVCSNFKSGVAERLGIDAETLHAEDAGKIVLLNSGFGLTGPRAAEPAFDPVMQAQCGIEQRAGGAGGAPVLNRTMLTDFAGGFLGQIAILMSLFNRSRLGHGMSVEVPLLNAGIFLLADIVRQPDGSFTGPLALLPSRTGYYATEAIYRALDGWVAVAARSAGEIARFADIIDKPDWGQRSRDEWKAGEFDEVARFFAPLDCDTLLSKLAEAGVPACLCNESGAEDTLGSDALLALGTIYSDVRPTIGQTRGLGIGYVLGSTPAQVKGSLASPGGDGRTILAKAGFDNIAIDRLITQKIVA